MILRFIKWLEEKLRNKSPIPWARFETAGIEDGMVRYDMAWNPAFLANLKKSGFKGHNEQEIVENFFLGSMIIPKDDALNAEVGEESLTPALSSEKNRFKS
jgi:hypothetical protein